MSLNVGDFAFGVTGQPGLVVAKDPNNAALTVQRKTPAYDKARDKGFINGLEIEERKQFNSILNNVRKMKDPEKKVAELQKQIQLLSAERKNASLIKYLNAELAHIMYSANVSAKEYVLQSED